MSFAIVEDTEFFAPVSHDLISSLIGQYRSSREKIEEISDLVLGDTYAGVMNYFIDGNKDQHARYSPPASSLFKQDGAIAALNSAYWSKTLGLTDVLDCMPQKRRDEWNKSISDRTAPDFEDETVRSTISSLLSMRHQFLAERVDGIFRSLSGEHVTNSPAGFSKRMIIGYVTEGSYTSHSKSGVINDLRAVIAKFMGRDEPKWDSTDSLVRAARRNHGQWMIVDGGALRIRCYIKGTAHLEVHPNMAYRLNQVLAHLYPMAIPSEFRKKPKTKHKEFAMMGRPLPFAVLEIISSMRRNRNTNTFAIAYGSSKNAIAKDEANRVIASIGGVINKAGTVAFDYDPREAIDEIIASGCIPDRAAHQFYPTPESIAEIAAEMAEIGEHDAVLEPSAGQGHLAAYLPDHTVCIEISKLHCDILTAKGYQATQADFIAWAAETVTTATRFDKVVMNPPFSEGRAKAHVVAASSLLKRGGRIVAILPASFKGKDVLPGFNIEWSRVFGGEFAGTSVSVVIMKATN